MTEDTVSSETMQAGVFGPRTLGDILSDTFRFFGGKYGANMYRLALLFTIALIPLAVLYLVLIEMTDIAAMVDAGEAIAYIVVIFIFFIFTVFSIALTNSAVVYAIIPYYSRRKMGALSIFKYTFKKLPKVLAAVILSILALGLIGVTIIGIPVAIYLSVRWSFIVPAIVVEDAGVLDSFRRSSDVVAGDWWRVLGITLLIDLIASVMVEIMSFVTVLPMVLVIVFSGGIESTSYEMMTLTMLLWLAAMAFVTLLQLLFSGSGYTLLYLDLTVRKGSRDEAGWREYYATQLCEDTPIDEAVWE